MAEPADVFLARNVGRIARSPEVVPTTHIEEIEVLDEMILEMAWERLEHIEDFSPMELDFFQRGEEEERIALVDI